MTHGKQATGCRTSRMRRARSFVVGGLATLASGSLLTLLAAAPCTTFDEQGLRPGMTLAQTRTAMGGTEDRLEVSTLRGGFETLAEFRRGDLRVGATFPDRVTARSKVGLTGVRWCVSAFGSGYATFVDKVRSRFGEPTVGGPELDSGLHAGSAKWASPGCRVEVRAFRATQWWDPSAEELCIDVRIVAAEGAVAGPAIVTAPTATTVVATAPAGPAPQLPGKPSFTDAPDTRPKPEATGTAAIAAQATEPVRADSPPPGSIPEPTREATPQGDGSGALAAREVAIANPPVEPAREQAPIEPDKNSAVQATPATVGPAGNAAVAAREVAIQNPPVEPAREQAPIGPDKNSAVQATPPAGVGSAGKAAVAAREVAIQNPPVEPAREPAPIEPDKNSAVKATPATAGPAGKAAVAAREVAIQNPPVEPAREQAPIEPDKNAAVQAPPATADPARNDPRPSDGSIGTVEGSTANGATASAPRLIASTPAQYPSALRSRRIQARVVVRATILPDGSVGRIEVAESSRPGFGFENRVIAAVRLWRYEPARQGGVPVTAEILIPFAFE